MFWKVIAFVHDKTNRLCATGYTMSQESFLTAEEFVYGEHDTAQRPIKWIEKVAGLSFGSLTTKDPKNKQRNLESVSTYLTDFEQIEFV
jgi:endonuclease G